MAHRAEAEPPGYLLRPEPPGTLWPSAGVVIRYRDFCDSTGTAPFKEATLRLSPPAPLLTSLGNAIVLVPYALWTGPRAPTCLPAQVAVPAEVGGFGSSVPGWAPVMRFTVTYKGETRVYGYGDNNPFVSPGRILFSITDTCGPGQTKVGGTATFAGHIAGAESDPPPVSVTFSVDCPPGTMTIPACPPPAPEPAPEPRVEPAAEPGMEPAPEPSVDAGAPDAVLPPPEEVPDAGPDGESIDVGSEDGSPDAGSGTDPKDARPRGPGAMPDAGKGKGNGHGNGHGHGKPDLPKTISDLAGCSFGGAGTAGLGLVPVFVGAGLMSLAFRRRRRR